MPIFGTPSYGGATSQPLTISKPVDLKNGDVLLLALRSQEGTNLVNWVVPSGFEEITAPVTQAGLGSKRVAGIWAKQIGNASAEPSSYSFTGPSGRAVGILIPWTPEVDGAIAIQGRGDYGGNQTSNGLTTLNARTNLAAGLSLMALGAEATAGISHAPSQIPAGYTTIGNAQSTLNSVTTGSRTAIWLGWKELPTNAYPSVVGGFAGASGSAAYEATITGGKVKSTPTYPGLEIPTSSGLSLLTVIDGAGQEVTPTGIDVWLPGFASVDDMIATPGATWAHRGGSNNWPEMSEWAFDQSVIAGYGALEFSAGRTSDGWWFGLHDESTNRTSGGTFGNALSQTRAQVEAQQIVIGASGAPRPYYGLLDFIAKYGETHILILDLKYAWNYQAEFLDLIVNNMDSDRAIFKTFAPGSGGVAAANAARAKGLKSWGFYYQESYDDGALTQTQSAYDLLGMDLTAGTAWTGPNNVLSFGKPVVGHIANSQAQYDLAMSKGSDMVQCSNVAGIKPVSSWT